MSSLPPLHKTKVVHEFRSSRLSTIPSSAGASSSSSRVVRSKPSHLSSVAKSRTKSRTKTGSVAPATQGSSSRAAMWAEALHSTHPPAPTSGGNATPGAPPQVGGGETNGSKWQQVQTVKQQARRVAVKVIESKVLTALVVFLATVLMLVCINPPMAQEELSAEELQEGVQAARSWKKIMVWSALVFVVALLLPVVAGYWRPSAQVSEQ